MGIWHIMLGFLEPQPLPPQALHQIKSSPQSACWGLSLSLSHTHFNHWAIFLRCPNFPKSQPTLFFFSYKTKIKNQKSHCKMLNINHISRPKKKKKPYFLFFVFSLQVVKALSNISSPKKQKIPPTIHSRLDWLNPSQVSASFPPSFNLLACNSRFLC